MAKNSTYWDKKLPKNLEESSYTPWLNDKLCVLPPEGEIVLDLGCGNGEDTAWLIANGYKVISLDFSEYAVGRVSKINKENTFLFDMSNPEDWKAFEDNSFSAIVANLSLHYFDDATTKMIIGEIKRILKPKGKLIARVNSNADKEFGAGDGVQLEEGFFVNQERGITKRFFSLGSANLYFSKIGYAAVCPKEITYIGKPKKVIEIVAQKEMTKEHNVSQNQTQRGS